MRNPGSSVADVYVIAAGILLGVMLGPAVLGRAAPGVYDRWFMGDGELARMVADYNREQARVTETTERLKATGVTDAAVGELEARMRAEIRPAQAAMAQALEARAALQARLDGRAMALLLAALVVMVGEAIVTAASPWRGRLATARYALLAGWLALTLARGELIRSVSLPFLAAVLLVALGVALMPIGRREPLVKEQEHG